MSLEEKRHLGRSLGKLLPENLNHVIQIIAQQNPAFNALADEVDVDIDAQVCCGLVPVHLSHLNIVCNGWLIIKAKIQLPWELQG